MASFNSPLLPLGPFRPRVAHTVLFGLHQPPALAAEALSCRGQAGIQCRSLQVSLSAAFFVKLQVGSQATLSPLSGPPVRMPGE